MEQHPQIRQELAPASRSDILLQVRDLRTHFRLDEGMLKAVDGISFNVHRHRVLGMVGESGCGKSVTAQSILQIVPKPGIVTGEMLWYRGDQAIDIGSLDPEGEEMRSPIRERFEAGVVSPGLWNVARSGHMNQAGRKTMVPI